jgi:hypothetical protein
VGDGADVASLDEEDWGRNRTAAAGAGREVDAAEGTAVDTGTHPSLPSPPRGFSTMDLFCLSRAPPWIRELG